MSKRIEVRFDPKTRMWICSPPGSWPTDWPTWQRAMSEADWYATMLREMHQLKPSFALRRRLRALQAQGFTPEWIAKKLDTTAKNILRWSGPNSVLKSPTMSRRIVRLYAWVDQTTGGRVQDSGPTTEAVEGKWCAPAAWDDIDDPDEITTSGFTGAAKTLGRQRTPIPEELRRALCRAIAAHNDRGVVLSVENRYQHGVSVVGERVGLSVDTVWKILRGVRRTMPADDVDRAMVRLGLFDQVAV